MQSLKDLLGSEHGLLAMLLIIAASVLVGLGKMTIDNWQTMAQWVFVTFGATHAAVSVADALSLEERSIAAGGAPEVRKPWITPRILRLISVWAALVVLVSCGPSAREQALKGTFATIDASRVAFTKWDAHHQDEIVQGATSLVDGRGKLEAYRAERKIAVDAYVMAYRALVIASGQTDAASLADALAAAKALADAIKQLTAGAVP